MLDTATKRRIDIARDILIGKMFDPKSQVEQITIALIYKFMDDIDAEQSLIIANRELVERMEGKVQAAIGRVWGEKL